MTSQETSAQVLVEELQATLTPAQSRLLGRILQFHTEHRAPYPRRRLAADVDVGGDIADHMHPLGGSIIRLSDGYGTNPHSYELTLLGALISPHGKDIALCLDKLLDYIRVELSADPDLKDVTAKDLASALYNRQTVVDCAGVGLYVGGAELGLSGAFSQHNWRVTIPNDVERFWNKVAPLDVIYATAANAYDPEKPVEASKQIQYSQRARSLPSVGFAFLPNGELRDQVVSDWAEATSAIGAKAWKAAAVMCGCVCEGALLGVLQGDPVARKHRVDLHDLIEAATRTGLLTEPDQKLSKVLLEYRNLVHPDRRLRQKASVTENEAHIAFYGTKVLITRLGRNSKSS